MNRIIEYYTAPHTFDVEAFTPLVEAVCLLHDFILERYDITTASGNAMALRRGVRQVPSLVFVNGCVVEGKLVGAVSAAGLRKNVDEWVSVP